jgi:hypothetical protein
MGMVIRFPDIWRNTRIVGDSSAQGESATVVILPVVRIEREPDKSPEFTEPGTAAAAGRRRRRPAARR